jgi:hypothetical protein
LGEEASLSGPSDIEQNVVRERGRATLHPEQVEIQTKLTKTLAELREGLEAARRVVLERTEMRVDDDGQFRSVPSRSRVNG